MSARLRTEIPEDVVVSEERSFSSDPSGVCLVSAAQYLVCNGHAGSHVDLPHHWLTDKQVDESGFSGYDDRQFNGSAHVIDMRGHRGGITTEMLLQCDVDWDAVYRVLFRTYEKTPQAWDDGFAYFTPEAAAFLASRKHIVCVGIDTPSVDHHSASPIGQCSHGKFWSGNVAFIENLCFNDCMEEGKIILGQVMTHWNDVVRWRDARPVVVYFFPAVETPTVA